MMKEAIVALLLSMIFFKSIIKTLNKLDAKSSAVKFFKDKGFFKVLCSENDVVDIEEKHAYNCGCNKHGYSLARMIIGVCLFAFMFKTILMAIR